jgi:microsomal dipeptidase-like Zn-dependent dipeptidase
LEELLVLLKSSVRAGASALGALAACVAVAAPSAHAAHAADRDRDAVYALANGCYAIAPAAGSAPIGTYAFKATGLGTFLLMDASGQLLGVRSPGEAVGPVGGIESASPAAEWAPTHVAGHDFTIAATASGRGLAATAAGPQLAAGRDGARLTLTPATGCAPVPEADVAATGPAPRPLRADGTVNGFADTHLHITADMRAGGSVIGGEPFDRFGVARALGQDAADHGADGSRDFTGNLLRDGVPFGTHDTGGWPAFTGWPVNDTNTHQQVYYRWLERAWRAGLRLTVAETVEDSELCRVEPQRRYPCDETTAIKGQIRRLRALQDYVDAQSGGPGRGWLRLAGSPAQARRAIARGQLAVIVGVESSFPLDCRDQPGHAQCTTAQVDRRLDALYAAGVRSLFIAHWADNGFAGAAIEGGVKGKFINALQRVEVGRSFSVGRCPDPSQGEELQALSPLEIDVLSQFFPATKALKNAAQPRYPSGRRCNTRGLTALGAHLVRRMMAKGMLIEMDHMSEQAREDVLKLAERARYPVVSGHSDTGGEWTTKELRRLTAIGGIASQRLAAPAALAKAIVARQRYRSSEHYFGVGLGTDTGGFSTLPAAPAAGTPPLAYPFRIDHSGVSFTRERTGERTFDYNTDGVAHYGLLPDLLADMQRQPEGRKAMGLLFRSAEAYLEMWELAQRRARS